MPQRKYSAEFKVRFVLEGLKSPDGIAAHCRRHGIKARKIHTLEEEIKRKDSIIAAVTEEALELKKKLIS